MYGYALLIMTHEPPNGALGSNTMRVQTRKKGYWDSPREAVGPSPETLSPETPSPLKSRHPDP